MNLVYYEEFKTTFRLSRPFQIQTNVREACTGDRLVGLDSSGLLTIAEGFAWDGASGPIDQAPNIVRGSLCHDAFYRLFRSGELDMKWRDEVDVFMAQLFEEDGLHPLMASAAYQAVRACGEKYARPTVRPVLVAPLPVAERVAPEWQAP
jgi:hypothetical protein